MHFIRQHCNTVETLAGLFRIEEPSPVPKYRQLFHGIHHSIMTGRLKTGELLPSINEISALFDVSRDTAEKGYRSLRRMGIIEAIPGKGFFISDCGNRGPVKICLLFNKLSEYKKIIYDAFVKTIGDRGTVDLFIYNNDVDTFRNLVNMKSKDYSHYVVLPHFHHGEHLVPEILRVLPAEKIMLLDRIIPDMKIPLTSVYQDFDQDIFEALSASRNLLEKYTKLNIVVGQQCHFPREILHGFMAFCRKENYQFNLITKTEEIAVTAGNVYLILAEEDLACIIEKVNAASFRPGKDVGIISYNDTPLKRVIFNGITTISTDFVKLGTESAAMILKNLSGQIRVPFHVNLRNTL